MQKRSHGQHFNYGSYVKTQRFGKRFTPQQELDAEQAFWFRISNPTIESSNQPPVKVEVPSELPKVSLVNASLKKLKFHLAQFDSVVKKRTTPDARTKGEWGFEHTKAVFNNEIIPFLKSLKDIFNVFDKDLLNEIMEVQTVFDQMDAVVQQFLVDKQCLEITKKELFLENDRLLQQIMSQDVLLTMINSMSLIEYFKNNDLKAQLKDKDTTIYKLKDIIKSIRGKSKGENVNYDYGEIETKNVKLENSVAKLLSENERLCMFKLDLEPLAPRLLQNREVLIEYLKYTQEQADILRELLVYVRESCPNAIKLNEKKVAVTPKNKVKKVRLYSGTTNIAKNFLVYVTIPAGKCSFHEYITSKGLGHTLFSVGQFCNADLEVAFQKNPCFICALEKARNTTSFNPKAKDTNQEKLYLLHMDLCCPMRVASINGKSDDLGKLDAKADIGIFVAMASKQFSSGPELHSLTPATSSSGLIPNTVS
ncbi:hypothetical protein Tco_0477797 [Tanacetum coccineum]